MYSKRPQMIDLGKVIGRGWLRLWTFVHSEVGLENDLPVQQFIIFTMTIWKSE